MYPISECSILLSASLKEIKQGKFITYFVINNNTQSENTFSDKSELEDRSQKKKR